MTQKFDLNEQHKAVIKSLHDNCNNEHTLYNIKFESNYRCFKTKTKE